MPQKRLQAEDVNFIMKAKSLEYSNCEIARQLGISEGAVRYRLKRSRQGKVDGRKEKASGLEKYHKIICNWLEEQRGIDPSHRPSLKLLYETLVTYHGCTHSYDAVRRYVRKHFPELIKKGVKIRLETPPGKLIQVDWKEDVQVQIGSAGNWVRVHALFLILGFSRKTAVIFSERKDLASFIHCHQEGFRHLGGLSEFIRMDCLKSAVTRWNGQETVLNEKYRNYLRELGIEAFPARPGTPTDKGKVEKKIRDVFCRLDLSHRVYRNMLELQQSASQKVAELEKQWRCGATGLSIKESFSYEKTHLKSLPVSFPRLPVKENYVRVRADGTVFFGGNFYQLKREYTGKTVLCINDGQEILIYYDGVELERFDYLPCSRGMVNLSEKALQGLKDGNFNISDKVLGWGLEVARRQTSIYNEIIENENLATGGMSA